MDAKYLGAMPASPVLDTRRTEHGDTYTEACYGLTKHEAFAMAAMQGILANPTGEPKAEYGPIELFPQACALMAIRFADALLAALAKEQP